MSFQRDRCNALQRRAQAVMPRGVNSNFRYWGDGITPYVHKAKGAYLWDVDGQRYIDYRLGFGPVILGHAHDEVDAHVREAIQNGVNFAMTSELEISLAEKIVAMCPAVDMVRLANSGTEATMHALRLARAFTGREVIVKFEGMYHGFQDYLLFSTYAPTETYASRRSPIPVPMTSGIPKCLHELVVTLPFNDAEVLDATLRGIGHQVAAIIAEPCLGNCGAIEPQPGFFDLVRARCDEYGILLILDEVKTGFRVARGGAQELYGIRPDLATYAKSMGNGYPVAAFGGRRDIMDLVGRGVAHGGTYAGNTVAVAAANATLDILQQQPVLETIARRGRRLMDGLAQVFAQASIPACLSGPPAMFSFAVGVEQVTDQRSWARSEQDYYLRLIEAAIERGVMADHDPREPWFLCYAHSEADVDETLDVMADAVRAVKR